MAKFPQRQIGQYKGPGWNVAPPSAGAFVGGGGQLSERAKSFAAFSEAIAGAGAAYQAEVTEEDFAEGQRRVLEGEAEFRRLEKEGLLDWTPAMMRGAQTMKGALDGHRFVRDYKTRMDAMTADELTDPELPAQIFDEMLAEHHAADREPNTYYDDGFNGIAVIPGRAGRASIDNYTSAASANAKDQAIKMLGDTTVTTVLDTLEPVKHMHPESDEYKENIGPVIASLVKQLPTLISGDGSVTDSGQLNTGFLGDGTWTANNSEGALKFVESVIGAVVSSGLHPQVALDVLDQINVGPHKLSKVKKIRNYLTDYKSPGGDFYTHEAAFFNYVDNQQVANIEQWNTDYFAFQKAAESGRLDEPEVKRLYEKLLDNLDSTFISPKDRAVQNRLVNQVMTSFGHNVIVSKNQSTRAAKTELEKTRTRAVQKASVILPAIAQRVQIAAQSTDPWSEQRHDRFVTQLASTTDYSKEEIKNIYDQEVAATLRVYAMDLKTRGIMTDPGEINAYVPFTSAPPTSPAPSYTPIPEAEQTARLAQMYINFAAMGDTRKDEVRSYYNSLFLEFEATPEKEDFLDSHKGLALISLAKAGQIMLDKNMLQEAVDTGSGAGDKIEHIAYRANPEMPDDELKTLFKSIYVEKQEAGDPIVTGVNDLKVFGNQNESRYAEMKAAGLVDPKEAISLIAEAEGSEYWFGLDKVSYNDGQQASIHGALVSEATRLYNNAAGTNPISWETAAKKAASNIAEAGMYPGESDEGNSIYALDTAPLAPLFEVLNSGDLYSPARSEESMLLEFADYLGESIPSEDERKEFEELLAQRIAEGEDVDVINELRGYSIFGADVGGARLNIQVLASGEFVISNADSDLADDTYILSANDVMSLAQRKHTRDEKISKARGMDPTVQEHEITNIDQVSDEEFDELYKIQGQHNAMAKKYGWEYNRRPTVHNYLRDPYKDHEADMSAPMRGIKSTLKAVGDALYNARKNVWNVFAGELYEGGPTLERMPDLREPEPKREWSLPVSGTLPIGTKEKPLSKFEHDMMRRIMYHPNYVISRHKTTNEVRFFRLLNRSGLPVDESLQLFGQRFANFRDDYELLRVGKAWDTDATVFYQPETAMHRKRADDYVDWVENEYPKTLGNIEQFLKLAWEGQLSIPEDQTVKPKPRPEVRIYGRYQ